ncbi:PQQ-dependent sugar dehydrogenase [Thermopolyspora sp. NPDC052614]|uniref:PQQ-dependent sugar dehydrogenase n=1 Tax=Thermopolyspora sp. NPDC052614 TaxID=3155682 RepID=UPI003446E791
MPNQRIMAVTAALALAAATAGCAGPEAAERVGQGRTPPPIETSAPVAPSDTPSGTPVPGPRLSPGNPRVLVSDLEVPWAIAFLPDGDALVTERNSARIVRVNAEGRVSEVGAVEGVVPRGEGGLMGIAVSPDFERDHFVFVYFTAQDDNRIVRYRYQDGLSDPKVILSGIPSGGIHNGGRIAFGPDGYLYAGTGETGQSGLAQDRESLGGKILRMTMDGEAPPGNPFGDSLVWTYGHRNVQGLAWDESGTMYATEFGQNTYDEINRIEKGHNYGWPEVEGIGGDDRYTDPLLTWSTDEASPSGLAYAGGSLWVAALRGTRLWQVPVADGEVRGPRGLWQGEYGRLRSVTPTPDGRALWVGTSNRDGRGSPAESDDRILLVPLT